MRIFDVTELITLNWWNEEKFPNSGIWSCCRCWSWVVRGQNRLFRTDPFFPWLWSSWAEAFYRDIQSQLGWISAKSPQLSTCSSTSHHTGQFIPLPICEMDVTPSDEFWFSDSEHCNMCFDFFLSHWLRACNSLSSFFSSLYILIFGKSHSFDLLPDFTNWANTSFPLDCVLGTRGIFNKCFY